MVMRLPLSTLAGGGGTGLARRSWRYTKLSLRTAERRQFSAQGWRKIYTFVSTGQFQEAGELMEKLVHATRVDAVNYLSEIESS